MKKKIDWKYIGLVAVIILVTFTSMVLAKEAKQPQQEKKELKEISGEVSAVNKDFIAIVYNKDNAQGIAYELALPIGDDIKIVHKQDIGEIKIGDTVSVRYEQIKHQEKDKEKIERTATEIKFLRSGN